MNKTAQDQIVNHFYNVGLQAALVNSGMEKNAKLSLEALHKLLAAGSSQSSALGKAIGQRQGGQVGTMLGGLGGAVAGTNISGNPILDVLLGTAGAGGGAALGNIVGRNLGGLHGQVGGYLAGLAPFRATGNFLADPLRRVQGIRG